MHALATPTVSIVAEDVVYTFLRRLTQDGGTDYQVQRAPLAEVSSIRPGSLFESGQHWQMVPSRLYRYEDRHEYLRGIYPTVSKEKVGVLSIPKLQAMGIFNRQEGVSDDLYSGNHVAELLLAGSFALAEESQDHALAFFFKDLFWLILNRQGQVVFVQAQPIQSDTDAVFFIAAHLQHFGLIRESCPLFVGGQISTEGQLYRQLSIYFDLSLMANHLRHDQGAAVQLLLAYGACLQGGNLQTS